MAALEFLVLSVPVRIGVEQHQKRLHISMMRSLFWFRALRRCQSLETPLRMVSKWVAYYLCAAHQIKIY